MFTIQEEMLSPAQLETWSLLFGTKYSGKTYKKMVNSLSRNCYHAADYHTIEGIT